VSLEVAQYGDSKETQSGPRHISRKEPHYRRYNKGGQKYENGPEKRDDQQANYQNDQEENDISTNHQTRQYLSTRDDRLLPYYGFMGG